MDDQRCLNRCNCQELDASSAVENPGRVVSSRQRNPEMLPNFSNKLRFFLESSLGAFQVLD